MFVSHPESNGTVVKRSLFISEDIIFNNVSTDHILPGISWKCPLMSSPAWTWRQENPSGSEFPPFP